MARPPRRVKNRDNARRSKKKVSALTIAKVEYVDYKDTDLLRKFVSDRSKIRARRVSGNDSRQQREVARAVKNAREMALLPYTSRVTTQRRERRNDDRSARADGPPPRPSAPPPGSEDEQGLAPGDEHVDGTADVAAEAVETEAVETEAVETEAVAE
jgi:small subunit ribosomal protein S18